MLKKISLLISLGFSLVVAAGAAHAAKADHDNRYIYIREAYFQMTAQEQRQVIDYSAQLLQNEVVAAINQVDVPQTLTNTLMDPHLIDNMTAEVNRAVQITDSLGRWWAPAGFMVYGGGSMGIGLMANGKASGDLGLVVVPQKVTTIDTMTGQRQDRFHIDLSVVVVPHLFVGIGVGAGVSGSVGVSVIFGNLTRAQDFSGAVLAGSVQLMSFLGLDVQPTAVHNFSDGSNYFVITVEGDVGPEAMASADGEIGAILPLGAWLQAHGITGVPQSIDIDPSKVK